MPRATARPRRSAETRLPARRREAGSHESRLQFDRYKFHADPAGKITVDRLDHPKRMFDLADGLIRRGDGDADIKLILGDNAVRVLGDIWRGV